LRVFSASANLSQYSFVPKRGLLFGDPA
jgi:hypothetical protein